jgi:MFS family permease
MGSVLRWIRVPLGALGGWYAALLVGLFLHKLVSGFCPSDMIVSGACTAPWFAVTERIITGFGAGLAAVLVVTLAALSAPSHRVAVARIAFVLGAVAAIAMAVTGGAWVECIAALACGVATLLVLQRTLASEPSATTAAA